ncbi:MAG TPA: hypothetical protein VGN97_12330 [Mesorhizobium sp.]|jgi:type III secretory pathway component EscT|nr:hypothetical protein [Mesorhizobium sp.]
MYIATGAILSATVGAATGNSAVIILIGATLGAAIGFAFWAMSEERKRR